MIKALIISLVSTWILELIFAWIVHVRDTQDLKLLLLVNFITNPIVVSLYWMLYTVVNPVGLIIVLETSAVVTEALYYRSFSNKISHPVLFAVSINLFSYLTGMIVQMI